MLLLDRAESLVDELLGGLGGDAAELGDGHGLADDVADLGVAGILGGLGGVDLLLLVGDGVGHAEEHPGLELARVGVGVDLDLVALHDGLLDRGLDGLDDEGAGVGAGDALLLLEILQERLDVLAHGANGEFGWEKEGGTKKAGPGWSPPSLKGD